MARWLHEHKIEFGERDSLLVLAQPTVGVKFINVNGFVGVIVDVHATIFREPIVRMNPHPFFDSRFFGHCFSFVKKNYCKGFFFMVRFFSFIHSSYQTVRGWMPFQRILANSRSVTAAPTVLGTRASGVDCQTRCWRRRTGSSRPDR